MENERNMIVHNLQTKIAKSSHSIIENINNKILNVETIQSLNKENRLVKVW